MKKTTFAPWAGALLCGAAAMSSATTFTAGDASELATAFGSAAAGDTVTLTADVDMTGWTPVTGFSGTFDGAGHRLTGVEASIFGTLSADIAIQNLVIDGANVTYAAVPAGILIDSVNASSVVVSNVTYTGCTLKNTKNAGNVGFAIGSMTVTGSGLVQDCRIDDACEYKIGVALHGGFVGLATASGADATITFNHCVMEAAVSSASSYGMYFGGIVGSAVATGASGSELAYIRFIGCTNLSSAALSGTNCGFGGIANQTSAKDSGHMGVVTVEKCANFGDFSWGSGATTAVFVGGLIGAHSNGALTMSDCINTGNIASTGASDTRVGVGGMVGMLQSPVKVTVSLTGCANTGDITGYYAGGLVGTLSHNANYASTKTYIHSCINTGTVTPRCLGHVPADAIGYLSSGVSYPLIHIEGGAYPTETLIGNYAEGALITDFGTAENSIFSVSEGLVDGSDLSMLNAFNDNCDLWKQGHSYPILKIMPDEAAPVTYTVQFVDWDGTVLKSVLIGEGGQAFAPENPERDGYTFIGWSQSEVVDVQANTTVTAQYQQGVLEYVVRFYSDSTGGEVISSQTITHGFAAEAPTPPTLSGYVFSGWSTDFSSITQDLDVYPVFVSATQTIADAADFQQKINAEALPGVTFVLSQDITLGSDWTSVDFDADLDGAGHTIYYSGTVPMFNDLHGTVSNFTVDGGQNAITLGNSKNYGMVAMDVRGGTVANVTIQNVQISTGSSAYVGLVASQVSNGGSILGCTTAESATLRQTTSAGAGGIVGRIYRSELFTPMDGEGTVLKGETLATIADCTNNAAIITYKTGNSKIGGIVGTCDVFNSTYAFNMYILRCVNNADITATVSTGTSGMYIGGILGQRSTNNSGKGGVLYMTDCANNGDIPAPGTAGFRMGGLAGSFYRGCATVFNRCVNRGNVGSATVCAEPETPLAAANGCSGGLFGYFESVYNQNPVFAYNCANYGDIYGSSDAGGFCGGADMNTGHGDTKIMFYNCANYGAQATASGDDGFTGEAFSRLRTKVATADSRKYGCMNCFFMTTNFYTTTTESVVVMESIYTAEDEGYNPSAARRALNAYIDANSEKVDATSGLTANDKLWIAAYPDSGYSTWEVGRIGPELLPFWDGYSPETLILFR